MISEADNRRIVEAIRAAETKTSGEIYCVIARACGEHHLVPVAWAALLAVPWPLIHFTKWPAGIIYLVHLATFIAAAAVVLSLPMIRFRIVPRRRLHGRAHVVAMQQFLACIFASNARHQGAASSWRQLLLAHCKHHAAHAHPTADMLVDGVRGFLGGPLAPEAAEIDEGQAFKLHDDLFPGYASAVGPHAGILASDRKLLNGKRATRRAALAAACP